MSGGSAPKNTTTTTKNEAPAYLQPYLQSMASMAGNIATQPYQAYEGPRIAPLTAEQNLGFNQIVNRAQNGSPETNAARDLAIGTMQGQGFRDPGQNQYLGAQTSVGSNPYMGAQNRYTGAQNPLARAQNQYTNVSNPWMGQNPYLDQTVQRAQDDVVNNYSRVIAPQTSQAASFAGAFGNSAHAQSLERDRENLMRSLGDVSTQMRGADYSNSQQLMQQDLTRRSGLASDDLSRMANISQSDLARNAGLVSDDLGRNASLGDADVARRMQAQQTDLARNAGLSSDDMSRQMAAYDSERGRQSQAMMFAPQLAQSGYQDIQALMGVGDFKRQMGQDAINQAYDEFTQRQQYPYQQLGFLGNALSAAQGGQSTSTQTAPNPYRPNTAAGILGGASSGAALGSILFPGVGTAAGGILGGLLGGI